MGILIVEDSETISGILLALLSGAGYTDVGVVASGEDALEILTECEQKPRQECELDLILMDIILPGVSGLNVCQRIQEMGHVALIPVVFLTARSDESVMAEAFEVGGWDFMVKPIVAVEFLVRVKAAIRKRQELQERISALVAAECS